MTKQTWNLALALSLLGLALIPSTSLAQVGLWTKGPGKNPASSAAQAASHQTRTPGAPSYSFTLLSFPGSGLDTGVSGLNPGATTSKIDVVGGYTAADGEQAGFLTHVSGTKTVKETYEAVNYPHEPTGQYAVDINDSGQIVGSYQDGSGVWHGYELSGGKFTTIDVPFANATYTFPEAINNSGEIVGVWGNNGDATGFTLIDGTYTSIEYPGASYTFLEGVNSQGDIVGIYLNANGEQGFLLSGGTYTSIEVPGAVTTEAIGLNDSGVIVGDYYPNQTNLAEGFVLSGGVFTTIAIPGEPYTVLFSINDNGVILGTYEDAAGLSVGFLATP